MVFNDLLELHADADDALRSILESVIYSKTIDYRRDVKHGKIDNEEKARTDAALRRYIVAPRKHEWQST